MFLNILIFIVFCFVIKYFDLFIFLFCIFKRVFLLDCSKILNVKVVLNIKEYYKLLGIFFLVLIFFKNSF